MNAKQIGEQEVPTRNISVQIIEPVKGWRVIDWQELWHHRDLFRFLVLRDIKTRYAHSVMGVGWAIIQPVFSMIVFTIVFGRMANVSSDGVPYAIFSYTALVPWTYFSSSLTASTSSLISSRQMLAKVYFPRLAIPIAPVIARLLDFAIAMLILAGFMLWFRFVPTSGIFALPLLILVMIITSAGMGMWLSALAIQYRDINYAMGFIIPLLMYAAPVVYPASSVPEQFQLIYALNPMVGVIEGFRSALLGTQPMPWDVIAIGSVVAILILVSGMFYFRRMERIFADVA